MELTAYNFIPLVLPPHLKLSPGGEEVKMFLLLCGEKVRPALNLSKG